MINALPWLSGIFMEFSPALVNCKAPSAPPDNTKSPAMSAELDKSNVAASSSPVKVTFLNDPISLSESTTTPKLADTVPAVTPSNTFNSSGVALTCVVLADANTGK